MADVRKNQFACTRNDPGHVIRVFSLDAFLPQNELAMAAQNPHGQRVLSAGEGSC